MILASLILSALKFVFLNTLLGAPLLNSYVSLEEHKYVAKANKINYAACLYSSFTLCSFATMYKKNHQLLKINVSFFK